MKAVIISGYFLFCFLMSTSALANSDIKKLESYLFPDSESYIKTQAFIVYKNNELIYEKYAPPYNKNSKFLSWSMAKTVSALLISIAEQENILKRSDTLGTFIPNLPPLKSSIKIQDLMRMSSGIKFTELYFGSIWKYDVHSMLFKNGTKDVGRYVLQLPMSYKPGERFYYSSGDSNLLMYILKKKLNQNEYDNFPFDKLFSPLGISSATFEQDESGTFLGSSFLYLSANDFAKLGELFLNKGIVNKKQIIKSEFLEFMATLTPSFSHTDNIDPINGYGAHLWINYTLDKQGNKKPVYPSLPLDTIFYQGIKGQIIGIIPSEKIIFVRLALDDDPGIHKDYYFSLMMNILKPTFHKPITYDNIPIRQKKEKDDIDSPVLEAGKVDEDIGINRGIFSFIELGNKFTARMICSCHFVQGLDLNFCEKLYSRYTYIFKTTIEKQVDQTVLLKVYNLFGMGKAKYRNKNLGCYAL